MSRKVTLVLLTLSSFIIAPHVRGAFAMVDTLRIQIDTFPMTDFKGCLDSAFLPIDETIAPTGILLDRTICFSDLGAFTGATDDSTASGRKLIDILACINGAAFVSLPSKYHPDTAIANAIQWKDSVAVPIFILDKRYHRMKSDAIDDTLVYLSNGKIYWDTTKSNPCEEQRVFLCGAYTDQFYSNSIPFIFKDVSVLSDRPDSVYNIFVNFADGNGFVPMCIDSIRTVTYCDTGYHYITVKLCFANDTLLSTFKIYLFTTETIQNHNSTWSIWLDARVQSGGFDYAYGDASVWLGCNNTSIRKPVLFVEGFDPLNAFNAHDIYTQLFTFAVNRIISGVNTRRPLVCFLRELGYDVLVLNFGQGGNWLQNNMEVFKQCLRDINSRTGGASEIIVIGASMGGVIARYALAEMESSNEAHRCKLFVAYDSPFDGAHIPLGLQFMARWFQDKSGWIPTDLDRELRRLNLPAARQLLKYYINPNGTIGIPHSYRSSFLSEMSGLPYPSQCRNIALVNGSLNATGQGFNAGDQLLHAVRTGTVGAEANIWSIPLNPTPSNIMADLEFWNAWGWITWLVGANVIYETATPRYISGLQPRDNAPGGQLNAVEQAGRSFDSFDLFGRRFHDFVPTQSALDINESFLNTNILSALPTTPFHAFYGGVANTQHIIPLTAPRNNINMQLLFDNEIMPVDLFLQNRTLFGKYEAVNTITAGSNVVPAAHQTPTVPGATWSTGPVIVPPGSNVTLQAGVSITLRDEFRAEEKFHALIAPIPACSTNVCTAPTSAYEGPASAAKKAASLNSGEHVFLSVYPNPAHDDINIAFELPQIAHITLEIYDLLGNRISSVFQGARNVGKHLFQFSSGALTEGTYIVRLEYGNSVLTKKFVISR